MCMGSEEGGEKEWIEGDMVKKRKEVDESVKEKGLSEEELCV